MDHAVFFSPTLFYIAFLCVGGLMGNSIVFTTYYRRFKASTIRTYILAMSVCDLLTNAVSLPMDFLFRLLNDVDFGPVCKINGAVKSFLVLNSAFILVAVALDRYRKICQEAPRPRGHCHVLPLSTRNSLCVCSLLAAICSIPHVIITGQHTFYLTDNNETGRTCFFDDTYVGSVTLDVYVMTSVALFGVCVATLAASYSLIARRLWQHKRRTKAALAGCSLRGEHRAGVKTAASCAPLPCDPVSYHKSSLESNTLEQLPAKGRIWGSYSAVILPQPAAKPRDVSQDDPDQNPVTVARPAAIPRDREDTVDSDDDFETDPVPDLTMASQTCLSQIRDVNAWRVFSDRPRQARRIPTSTTWMMFVLTAVFVLNFLPYLVTMAVYRGRDVIEASSWGLNLYQVAVRSYFINSAINPLVYGFCSASFRHHCRRLFCHCGTAGLFHLPANKTNDK